MKISIHTVILLLSLLLFIPTFSFTQEESKELTLRDVVFSRKFFPRMVYGMHPMRDGKHYCVRENDSLNIYDYHHGNLEGTVFTSQYLIMEGDTTPIKWSRYTFSKDESKVLIPTETESIYRHSSKSYYYVYDLETRKLQPLSSNGKQRLADFSPDASKVAFIRKNNIFIEKDGPMRFHSLQVHIMTL